MAHEAIKGRIRALAQEIGNEMMERKFHANRVQFKSTQYPNECYLVFSPQPNTKVFIEVESESSAQRYTLEEAQLHLLEPAIAVLPKLVELCEKELTAEAAAYTRAKSGMEDVLGAIRTKGKPPAK